MKRANKKRVRQVSTKQRQERRSNCQKKTNVTVLNRHREKLTSRQNLF